MGNQVRIPARNNNARQTRERPTALAEVEGNWRMDLEAGKKFWVSLFAGALLLAAVVFSVTHFGELKEFIGLLGHIDPYWIAPAFLFQLTTYLALALVWRQAFSFSGVRYPVSQLLPLALAKLFADQALPTGGISGIAFVINAFRRRDVPGNIGMGVMLVSILSYYGAYLVVAAVSLVLLLVRRELNPWIITIFAFFLLVALAIPTGVLLLKQWGGKDLPPWVLRIPAAQGILKIYAEAPGTTLRNPLLVLEAIALQSAIFLLDSATLWAMLYALGEPVPLFVAFPCFVFSSIVAMLSLIPLGMGSFEATGVALLTMSGVRLETALAAMLLLRGFTLWLPMVPGLLLTRKAMSHTD